MAFRFTSTGYHFPTKWTAAQRTHAEQILTLSIKHGGKAADVMKMYKKAGISYRKTNMLDDIGRAQATETSKTVGAYNRASSWFDQAERVRKENPGMSRKEAAKFMTKWKYEAWENAQEWELAGMMEAEGGCPSPPC